ncbi:MAG: NPCBM/NEW2 domain-containing protein [Planctomycetota bacterium]|nr:NPCBM/NEW2 domain-containing protein [Planctomycetota bacterium]
MFSLAGCLLATLANSFSFAAEKKFGSPVVTQQTSGHSTAIELDITGAKILALEVTDGGDGTSYDWADWIEPQLIGPGGELKLTDLKWQKPEGKATVGRNNGGGHFANFLNLVDTDSTKRLSAEQAAIIAPIREKNVIEELPIDLGPRELVRKWAVDDLLPHLSLADTGRWR